MDSVPLDHAGMQRLHEAHYPERNQPLTLRQRIEVLIAEYRDDDNCHWIDQVPYLVRTTVVDELREALDG